MMWGTKAGVGLFALTLFAASSVATALVVGSPDLADAGAAADDALVQDPNPPYDSKYHFLRIQYTVGGGGGFGGRFRGGREPMWAHDYPRAERNFLQILSETTYIDSQTEGSNIFRFDDPELFNFPIAYIVEVGSWSPNESETKAVGDYLLKGGFLIVDDTRDDRGTRNYDSFAFYIEQALPDLKLVPLSHDHDIFDSFFQIDPLEVLPPYGRGNPMWFGIFEENDPTKRLMVVLNYNNDIAEYWEFSERGYYPINVANEAYKLGVNYVVYGLTH
jgi:hypothetical protein